MTNAEMNRRLATMSEDLVVQVRRMVRQGYGAHSITLETPANLKQVNAVFQQYWAGQSIRVATVAMDSADLARANID